MKMIRAIIRPEKSEEVADALDDAGFPALTKMDVIGRGKQKGIRFDEIYYDEIPKTMLLIVVDDADAERVVSVISESGYTGKIGDGKIFISPVENAYTVRTREEGL